MSGNEFVEATYIDGAASGVEEEVFSDSDTKHNMKTLVLLDAAYWTGQADLALVMQPFLVWLNATNTMIGFVTGASFMGLIGVFLTPWITRRFRYKKNYFFGVNVPYLTCIGLTGLAALLYGPLHFNKPTLLWWIFGLTLGQWLFGGFCTVPSMEYIAACIPSSHRGRLMGYSFLFGGMGSVAAAYVGGRILHHIGRPVSFGYVLLISWFICQLGFVAALFAREKPTPVERSPKPWSKTMLVAAWKDKQFIKFLVFFFSYTILISPVYAFVNIFGFKKLGMVAATAATIQIITQAARMAVSGPAGHYVDKLSPRRIIPYCFIFGCISLLPVIFYPHPYSVYVSAGLSSIFSIVLFTAQSALLFSIPSPEDRGGHFTIQLIFQYIAVSGGAILAGKACDLLPYKTVFIITAILCLVMVPFAIYILRTPKQIAEPAQ